ncbi:MAG: hypothetical protein JXB62_08850, partial [Pirellulales bacterium]|nr:hypothetical protein [Pirellulales bacterium]
GSVEAEITTADETDSFTIDLDDGQTLTVLVEPEATLQPLVELKDPDGITIGAVTSSAAGESALLQTIPTTGPGTYTMVITDAADATGSYTARLILNAALENEQHEATPNDDLASAQDLQPSFIMLGVDSATRGAVLGTVGEPGDAEDWYRFTLDDGQSASVVLKPDESDGVSVELYDEAGVRITWGLPAHGGTRTIDDFVDPADDLPGEYFVRVGGDAVSAYGLAILRDTGFDPRTLGETIEPTRDVGVSGNVLAHLDALPQDEIFASDAAADAYFGSSVAISGDLAIIGAHRDNEGGRDSGAAYVFRFDGEQWIEQQKLTASDATGSGYFGYSVAISGDTAIVGAPWDAMSGSAYIFEFDGSQWVERQTLTASDAARGDQFGRSVAIRGNTAIVGAWRDDDAGTSSGSVYVFEFDGSRWTEEQKLTASDATGSDYFGHSVAISGDTAIVGAYGNDDAGSGSGSAYVFQFDGSGWTEEQKLAASDAATGDRFGWSVAVNDGLAIVGAEWDADAGGYSGSAYVFQFDGGRWVQRQKLAASDAAAGDYFGNSVAVCGDTVIVGAMNADATGIDSGAAYRLQFDGQQWIERQKLTAANAATGAYFGCAVATDGTSMIVGAYSRDFGGVNGCGSVTLMTRRAKDYTTLVEAGGTLVISTTTPSVFANPLDPRISLYDPEGNLVGQDDNSGPDGRNARLEHTAAASGEYVIRVASANDAAGEYVLSVDGQVARLQPLRVVGTVPADGEQMNVSPGQMRVELDAVVHQGTVEATDLTIDGIPAEGVTVIDVSTVEFDLPPLPDGMHTAAIGGGAFASLQGTPSGPLSIEFWTDTIPPRVVESLLLQGGMVPDCTLAYTARFDEQLDATHLDATNVSLVGLLSGALAPDLFEYDPTSSTLRLEYAGLPEDSFTLTLASGNGRLEDLVGNDLDGEPDPISTVPSGDGEPGGDFTVTFCTDIDTDGAVPLATPLAARPPHGSSIYESSPAWGAISDVADTDRFTIDVDGGLSITVLLEPGDDLSPNPLRPAAELLGPGGTLLDSAVAAEGRDAVILQSISSGDGGPFTVVVDGDLETVGTYRVQVVLNADLERESYSGPANDEMAAAEDLDGSFLPLGDAGVQRGAVLGTIALFREEDWYRFTLDDGESADLVLAGPPSSDRLIELYGDGGTLLAQRRAVSTGHEAIVGLVDEPDGLDGAYFVRVGGRPSEGYSLVVNRNAALNMQPRNELAVPRDLTQINGALGWLDRVSQQEIADPDPRDYDRFGQSVAIDGNLAIVGVSGDDRGLQSVGTAYIYWFDGREWVQRQKLTASDGSAFDYFGGSVAISGHTVIVGATGDDHPVADCGSVYVFRLDGEQWVQQQRIVASDPATGARFGGSVTLHGDTVIVGAEEDDTAAVNSGSAYVFRFDGTQWIERQKLTASDAAAADWFGHSVAISGDTAILGAYGDHDAGGRSGSAYVFRFDGEQWLQQEELSPSDGVANCFGCSVAINGDTAIIGDRGDDEAGWNSGSASVFRFDGDRWIQQQKLTAPDRAADDCFGCSVSISGDTVIVGANYTDDAGSESGSAYIFRFDGSQWIEQHKLTAFNADTNDEFGHCVAIGANAAIVGAPDRNTAGIAGSGAAYIYMLETLRFDPYTVNVNAGDELFLATTTPGGGPGEFVNLFDPAVELYDPDGDLVAGDDNGGADGRNVSLQHTAPVSGEYTIRVLGANDTIGEYFLQVTGHTGDLPAFEVSRTDPADGAVSPTAPRRLTVDFNDPFRFDTLEAADLTVDGVPATKVTIVDLDTVIFDLPGLSGGVHEVSIAGGAILDLQNTPIEPFVSHLTVDQNGPRVIASSILYLDTLPRGPLVYVAEFDEQLDATDLDVADVWLTAMRGGRVMAEAISYSAAPSRLTVQFPYLAEDEYNLSLYSDNAVFRDVFGQDLDGERHPELTVPSGDGHPGGSFLLQFSVDTSSMAAEPFGRLRPYGSLMFESRDEGLLNEAGDVDEYLFPAEAGEAISIEVWPEELSATLTIEIVGLVAPLSASAAGEAVGVPVVVMPAGGTYALRVGGDRAGRYGLRIGRGCVAEVADTDDGSELAIDDSVQPLGSGRYGVAGAGERTELIDARVWGVQPATGRIIALDPVRGNVLESFAAPDALTPGHTRIGLCVAEDAQALLYVNSDVDPNVLYRLDPATGAVLSTETIAGGPVSGLGYDNCNLEEILYAATMDQDPGWTLEGDWQFGVPTGDGGTYPDPESGITGDNVIGYNLDGAYAGNIPAYHATMPPFNASGYDRVVLGFWRWLGVTSVRTDHATIEVSHDDTSWTTVWENGVQGVLDESWTWQAVDISAVAANKPTVTVRFGMGPTDEVGAGCGWNIDDVVVTGTCETEPRVYFGDGGNEIRRQDIRSATESSHFTATSPATAIGGDAVGRQFAFVPGQGIVEFDPRTPETPGATLPAPAADVEGLAFDGKRLYASTASGLLYTLDPFTGAVLAAMEVPEGALFGLGALSATRGRSRLFVANCEPDTITELDPQTGAVLNEFPAPWGVSSHTGLAFDGTSLFFATYSFSSTSSKLYQIDPDTGATLRSVSVPFADIEGLAALGGRVYIFNEETQSIHVYNPVSNAVTRSLAAQNVKLIADALGAICEPEALLVLEEPLVSPRSVSEVDPYTGVVRSQFPVPLRTKGLAAVGNEIFCGTFNDYCSASKYPYEIFVHSRQGQWLRSFTWPSSVTGLAGAGQPAFGLAQRTELLVNGDFETGDFTGWTATSNGLPALTPWTVGPAAGGFFFDSAPRSGAYSAYNGLDGAAGLEYELYQDVAIPVLGDQTTLITNHRIAYTGGVSEGQARTFEISVRDTENNLLETLYTETIPAQITSEVDRGWRKQRFDLTTYRGQVVRIHFRETIPESFAGPALLELDGLSLVAEDLLKWALPDVDEYTLDLSGKAGHSIDVVLAGQDGADFSEEILELLDPDGQSVLATAVPDPLGLAAGNYDLAILGFAVAADGVYTLRLTSSIDAEYGIVVTDSAVFDTEPNDSPTDLLRGLRDPVAVGYLDAAEDADDWYAIELVAGDALEVLTKTPSADAVGLPPSTLDPRLRLLDPDGQVVADDHNSAADGRNAMVRLVASESGRYLVQVVAGSGYGEYTLEVGQAPEVFGRYVFYNNSAFDGNDPGANPDDDAAMATDKVALLPGQTASFANYTSYARGINGIMVDIAGLTGTPTAADFQFRVGNSDDPSTWATAPEPTSVSVRPGEGLNSSDRVTLVWPDNAIQKQWLQVTVLATVNTGLEADDVFYFGNAVAEAGNSATDAKVNATDMLLTRNNPRTFLSPAAIDFPYDCNRDARVDATDMLLARNNQTHFLNALKLITVPGSKDPKGDGSMVSTETEIWDMPPGTGQDRRFGSTQIGVALARDVALTRAADLLLGSCLASLGERDWLYEFERMRDDGQPSEKARQVEEPVDSLLQMWSV